MSKNEEPKGISRRLFLQAASTLLAPSSVLKKSNAEAAAKSVGVIKATIPPTLNFDLIRMGEQWIALKDEMHRTTTIYGVFAGELSSAGCQRWLTKNPQYAGEVAKEILETEAALKNLLARFEAQAGQMPKFTSPYDAIEVVDHVIDNGIYKPPKGIDREILLDNIHQAHNLKYESSILPTGGLSPDQYKTEISQELLSPLRREIETIANIANDNPLLRQALKQLRSLPTFGTRHREYESPIPDNYYAGQATHSWHERLLEQAQTTNSLKR